MNVICLLLPSQTQPLTTKTNGYPTFPKPDFPLFCFSLRARADDRAFMLTHEQSHSRILRIRCASTHARTHAHSHQNALTSTHRHESTHAHERTKAQSRALAHKSTLHYARIHADMRYLYKRTYEYRKHRGAHPHVNTIAIAPLCLFHV